jgi:hypothetical protein
LRGFRRSIDWFKNKKREESLNLNLYYLSIATFDVNA